MLLQADESQSNATMINIGQPYAASVEEEKELTPLPRKLHWRKKLLQDYKRKTIIKITGPLEEKDNGKMDKGKVVEEAMEKLVVKEVKKKT